MHGRAAHGSRPHLGIDAIAKMGRVLVGIEELDRRLRASPTHARTSGAAASTRRSIEGGQEYSSYPARCVLQAERRTIPGETVELVERELREILVRAGEGDPDFSADLALLFSREPFEVAEDAEIVTAVRRNAAAVLGTEPELVGASFWADSALLASAGIPTVLFGPIGEGAHAEVEWVDVASLERASRSTSAVGCGASAPSARGSRRSPRLSPRTRPRARSARRGRRRPRAGRRAPHGVRRAGGRTGGTSARRGRAASGTRTSSKRGGCEAISPYAATTADWQ